MRRAKLIEAELNMDTDLIELVEEATEDDERFDLMLPVGCNTCKYRMLGSLAKKPNRRVYVPSDPNPQVELRRLMLEHSAATKRATSIINMATDKKNRDTGEVIPCRLPDDVAVVMIETARVLKKSAKDLEPAMIANLKQMPIYDLFLRHVFGLGPVVCAYLVASVDINISNKPSQLRRYCGLAVHNGRLERPERGGGSIKYNGNVRTRLYQAFSAMRRNASQRVKDGEIKRGAVTSKYLTVWSDYKHRMQQSERYDAAANTIVEVDPVRAAGKEPIRKGARGMIDSTGWHKAADVLIEDLYVVWRAIEGLPVWPSYYAAKLGYEHGGKVRVLSTDAPRMLSVDEALALVGDVGARIVPAED